jgi:endonuclease G
MKKTLFKYLALLALVASFAAAPSCTPDQPAAKGEAGWVELPVMKSIDGVEYLTYYVSNDGMSMAQATTPARKRNVTMAFDTERHAPLWVAYPMHTWYWANPIKRTDAWGWDPTLPREVQPDIVTKGSYWQDAPDGAFSRGHLLASADRLRSVPMNTQTFYVTNLAPQVNNGFNATVWADLEEAVRDYWSGSGIDTLYCVTGLAYELLDGKQRVTFDKRSPRMEVKVPSHFYKVLLQRKDRSTTTPVGELPASELRAIGFWFENNAYPTGSHFEDAAVSVSDIEERVGLEFFPLLSADGEKVKDTLNPADWGID